MITENQIEAFIDRMFREMEFSREPSGLYDPLRYMIEIGGKRVRPRLCLLTYSLFKDSLGDEILQPAAALEVFHSFTLIHDDIMDKAEMRRGVPTVCRKWNDNTAILSGDVMLIDSYVRIAKAPAAVLPDVVALFSRTAAEVCEGQQYDMDFEKTDEIPMDLYMKMIGLKTAVLIACAAKTGALIGGASPETCDLLYDFGYRLGLAFQITDDYLDTYGDPAVFGKSIGGDILNNKKTWLLTRALEKGAEADKEGISENCGREALLEAMKMDISEEEGKKKKIARVREIYDALGIGEEAKAEIVRLHSLAMDCAARTELGKVKYEMLHRYAERLLGRNR